jgi:hypothetical protein
MATETVVPLYRLYEEGAEGGQWYPRPTEDFQNGGPKSEATRSLEPVSTADPTAGMVIPCQPRLAWLVAE